MDIGKLATAWYKKKNNKGFSMAETRLRSHLQCAFESCSDCWIVWEKITKTVSAPQVDTGYQTLLNDPTSTWFEAYREL